jgi:hypothetical protein
MNNDAIPKANGFVILKMRGLFFFTMMVIGYAVSAQTVVNDIFKGNSGIVPVMKITNLQKDETDPMKIDELKIDIKIMGQIAVTTMEFSYFNMNDREMEGEFNFPLAEGQTVSRFALDINGQMREGVVVEKEQGRKTFEAVARRRVDPGLLEMKAGNNFSARVYPLPARGYRRIIIAYEQEIADKGQGYLYQLPLKIADEIRDFSIHAEVIKQQVKLDSEKNELSNFEFKQWNDSYLADFKKENYLPDKQLAFMIPYNHGDVNCYAESISEGSDSTWFYFNLRPKQFNREKKLPQKTALFWDNSNSCGAWDIDKELLLLDGYFQKIGNLQVELVPFNIRAEKSKVFNVAGGNWSDLRKALLDITYDGGTSFGVIDFSKYVCDEFLLFSDGLSDFGLTNPTFSKVPVICINSNVIANHSFLTYISQNTGGRYINLTKLTAKEALGMLTTSDYHFISAKIIEGNISEVYPSMPAPFQNTFSQSGILKGKSATILLNFGFGNEVVYTEKVVISNEKPGNTGILRRTWAQKKLQSLMINEEDNKDIISHLGKEYSIVTPNTSLIVLDNLEDYLQYHIVPPKEMQTDYFSRIKLKDRGANDQIKNHLDMVATMFEARVKWWNTVYPKKEVVQNRMKSVRFSAPVVVDEISAVSAISENRVNQVNEEPVFSVVEEQQTGGLNANHTKKLTIIQNDASIQLNAWDPKTPYLKVLEYTGKGQEYETYLKLKKEYGTVPGFYADAFDFFMKSGKTDLAVIIISNLAELELDNPQLLRILGQKLLQAKYTAESVEVYKKVLKLRGEDPQSYRDLGLAYEADGQYQPAISTLYEVVKREWNGRFPGVELIAMDEINNIIANHKLKADYSLIDRRLIKNLPVDIRVVLTWDTDNCDMDLWVTDPSGEKCAYDHTETMIGGIISHDFTQGYGPEVFLLKKATGGKYLVQANYFGTNSNSILAPVTLHLTFFTNYGKPNQQKQETTIRLENKKDVIDVGKFTFGL